MAHIHLIRHGQASFGTHKYDRLSELGHRQAEVLGLHMETLGQGFDAMFSGTMDRQKATAERARAQLSGTLPALQIDAAFNEYDADGLFRAYLPRVFRENPELAARQKEMLQDRALFQQIFVLVTRCWLDAVPTDGIELETWEAFRTRVTDGLQRINQNNDKNARVAVFTSGGAIAVSVATTLDLPPQRTLQVNWGVYNASITELKFRRTGPFLLGFNNITHLLLAGDPALITHR